MEYKDKRFVAALVTLLTEFDMMTTSLNIVFPYVSYEFADALKFSLGEVFYLKIFGACCSMEHFHE